MRSMLTVLWALFWAVPVQAQTLPEVPRLELSRIPAGDDQIVPVSSGKAAPFSGQLYTPETALRWANYLEQYRLQVPALLDTQRKLYQAELDYQVSVLKAHQEMHEAVVADTTKRLERLEATNLKLQEELAKGPPWYNSRDFGVVLGVVGTVGVVALSIWAVSAAAQ